jgi:Zn-dependent protease
MQRYTPRDIVILALIAGLFIWYYGSQPGFGGSPEGFVITILALVVAVTFHEFAHAFIALQLGDATAKLLGRVSLNPIRHLDLFGSLAFIFFQFGWGKPVPINPYNMRTVGPLTGDFLATIAGPVSNVLLAFLVTVPFRLELIPTRGLDPYLAQFIQSLLSVNIALAAFNFLPIPPLDGFSIARLFLPRNVTGWLEQYGMFVLIALVFLPQFLGRQFDFLGMVTGPLRAMITSLVFIGM